MTLKLNVATVDLLELQFSFKRLTDEWTDGERPLDRTLPFVNVSFISPSLCLFSFYFEGKQTRMMYLTRMSLDYYKALNNN